MALYIGTAGWSISTKHHGDRFPREGSGLERYASRFPGVEINSSFYRPHRLTTWQRWAATVPEGFRFSVKIPKTISHERRLVDCDEPLAAFAVEVAGLGDTLGVLLVQLPPTLAFEAATAAAFFTALAAAIPAPVACEPRHPSWFEAEADALLDRLGIARVAADPARVPAAAEPGGWRGLAYWRLHGSPEVYRSSYDDARLDRYAAAIADALRRGHEVWCVFDNTMGAAATANALDLIDRTRR